MNIGRAATETGLSVKTIRYYEEIGLVEPERAENGYRDFGDQQITQLRMLAQARHLGFGLEECRRLLDLNADPARASRDVKALALRNLDTVRSKIGQLQALEGQLETLISQCPGDDDPHCAILNGLNGRSDPLSGEPD
ncbi:Cu(I)-responsive transcriptional regulator [Sulfitobacter sp. G21635-S1]|jgi:Cu(I)-responsive transcriptional regulator|uniref:Cu(I)-responsive transcriptional regulator n=1 Tax=Sulfitobacter sp. G21635-S1 TaxID=3014043 RepID=UPI0022AEDABC|nr:Cu(I)-responsive transcriptional regulator [Sulfitobacter sp. G21635-S1]MCZ4258854.1 Cu(I)-responsive transcriptional regulator [Sulfitobacter sp. G21635-S1]